MVIRFLSVFLTVGAVVVAVAGAAVSGGTPPSPVTVDAVDYAYVMPPTLKGPVVALRLRNRGKELHEFSLGRVDGTHTVADVLAAFRARKHPAWLHDVGGPGLVSPGASLTYTRSLQPGRYVFLCAVPDHAGRSHLQHGMIRAFTVAGGGGTAAPTPDAVITAAKKGFVVPAIAAGSQTLEFRNRAGAGRGLLLATIDPGKTQADVDRWTKQIESTGKQPRGPMPMTLLGATQTIPNGASVFVTVKLDAGRTYHVSDDESGAEATFTPR
jgi:uncharacterized cupredoxin-like copper-binding protein